MLKRKKGIPKKAQAKSKAKGELEPYILSEKELPDEEKFKYHFDKTKRKGTYFLEDRYQFKIESGISAKKNWFTYRDHKTGRYVKKSEIHGKVRMELWRYSKTAEHKFKMLWREKHYTFLKKARSLDKERMVLKQFYRRNNSRFVWDKDLCRWIAFTRSP
jgi:hypothetical protein